MIEVIVDDEQGTIWEVPSHSSNETYIVTIDEDNLLFCTCPDFMYRRLKGRIGVPLSDCDSYCKHIREVLNENL